jgi:hypothetical protein
MGHGWDAPFLVDLHAPDATVARSIVIPASSGDRHNEQRADAAIPSR